MTNTRRSACTCMCYLKHCLDTAARLHCHRIKPDVPQISLKGSSLVVKDALCHYSMRLPRSLSAFFHNLRHQETRPLLTFRAICRSAKSEKKKKTELETRNGSGSASPTKIRHSFTVSPYTSSSQLPPCPMMDFINWDRTITTHAECTAIRCTPIATTRSTFSSPSRHTGPQPGQGKRQTTTH